MLSSLVGQRQDGSLHYQENIESTLRDKGTLAIEKPANHDHLSSLFSFLQSSRIARVWKDFEILVQLKRETQMRQ